MITKSDLDFYKLREARYDFIEPEVEVELAPSQRPLGRIGERVQIFTYQDLHNDSAALRRDIEKAEIDISPKFFKLKVHNLKVAMQNQLDDMKRQKQMLDDEIKIIDETLHIDEMDTEYHAALHKKLKEEAKLKLGAEPSV